MATNDLTRKQAEIRKKQVSNVKYQINLSVNKTDLDYKAQTTIFFDFKKTSEENLMIDFITKEITSLLVNGQEVSDYNKDDYIDGTAELIGKRAYLGEQFSLKFNPRVSFILSEENINPEYYFYEEFLESEQTRFGLINTQFRFPIYMEINRLSAEASYSINFPRDILKKETLSSTAFYSLTIGYLFSF